MNIFKKILGSIGKRVTVVVLTMVVLMLIIVGSVIYKRVEVINRNAYNEKLNDIIAVTDSALNEYFSNLTSTVELFSELDLIKRYDNNIKSFVDANDPSGKVPMGVDYVSDYEKKVYFESIAFTKNKSEVGGIGIALEETGGYAYYPPSPRSNGYDPRSRS